MSCDASQVARFLQDRWGNEPFDLTVVCGSGWGHLAEDCDRLGMFRFGEIPGLPSASVPGQAGQVVAATIENRRVVFFQGRFHIYQGLSAWEAAVPVQVAAILGCKKLLLTNAAGGINGRFRPGDLMFIGDHINLLGDNPLRGLPNPFIDLGRLYRRDLFEPLLLRSRSHHVRLHDGILAALPGPSFETPAEIAWLERMGVDAVSMSTVPEAIMGAYLGMDVVGISLIANLAAGRSPEPLSHQDVLAAGEANALNTALMFRDLISLWKEPS